MTAKRSAVGAGLNGVATGRAKRTAAATATAAAPVGRSERARHWVTVGMGCGTPVMTLALSAIGGGLYDDGQEVLGAMVLGLCGAILAVSLSHLARAIRDITRSAPWQSWCMAAAVDVALILGELACIVGGGWWLVYCVMGLVTVASAVLNCWDLLGPVG